MMKDFYETLHLHDPTDTDLFLPYEHGNRHVFTRADRENRSARYREILAHALPLIEQYRRQGLSYARIAARLNSDGVPSFYKKKGTVQCWGSKGIYYICKKMLSCSTNRGRVGPRLRQRLR